MTSGDVRRVIDASKIINLPADRQIIHALPRYFTVDGQEGVTDPVGMSGGRLEVDTHIVTGGTSFITNVLKCVHRAGLETGRPRLRTAGELGRDAAPGGEARRRRACSTSAAGRPTSRSIRCGSAIYTATIPVGGNILTNDISLGLKTTLAEAEEVKKRARRPQSRRRRRRVVRRHVRSTAAATRNIDRRVAADRRAARSRDAAHG